MDTATVAMPVASVCESSAHEVSSPATEIVQSQLASSLHAPAASSSAKAAAARKKLFKSLFFIIAYFLRSTSTGRWSETVITLISSYEGTAVRSTSYDGELPV